MYNLYLLLIIYFLYKIIYKLNYKIKPKENLIQRCSISIAFKNMFKNIEKFKNKYVGTK